MNFYVIFFLPCVIGLFAYYVLTKEKKYFNLVLNYFINVLITGLISIGIYFVKDGANYSLVTRAAGDFRFAFKYMLLATVISLVVGVVSVIIKKYCSVSIEVKNGRKK